MYLKKNNCIEIYVRYIKIGFDYLFYYLQYPFVSCLVFVFVLSVSVKFS